MSKDEEATTEQIAAIDAEEDVVEAEDEEQIEDVVEAEDEEQIEDVVEETPPEMLTVEILKDCSYQVGRVDAEIENVELVKGSVIELPVELAMYFAGTGAAELSKKKIKTARR